MDYESLKALMESGHGEAVALYLQAGIDSLRDQATDPNLPAEQYKVNDLGRQEALDTLKRLLTPFLEYRTEAVRNHLKKDSLYYTHAPRLPEKKSAVI